MAYRQPVSFLEVLKTGVFCIIYVPITGFLLSIFRALNNIYVNPGCMHAMHNRESKSSFFPQINKGSKND
jgi:hypothetical protein